MGAGVKAWETRRANEAARQAARQLNDAHYVRDLYRKAFQGTPKGAARSRAIAVLKAAGGTVVLDLWGGGLSALELMAAGYRVIAVDDGSMPLTDADGHDISKARKKRALRITAEEDGYEWRWGKAAKYAFEADCALLDFHGNLGIEVYRTVKACYHMKAVIVTLMTDHEAKTGLNRREFGALTQPIRRIQYEATLRFATMGPSRKTHGGLWRNTGWKSTRLLCTYRRAGRQPVWLFLLAPHRIVTGPTHPALIDADAYERRKGHIRDAARERRHANPDAMTAHNANGLAYYHRMKQDPEWLANRNVKRRATRPHSSRVLSDKPENVRRRETNRHYQHVRRHSFPSNCELCVGRLGPASPA